MKEDEFISWIRSQSQFDPKLVHVGPGDDCAIVACAGEEMVITADQVLDGVHFVLAEHGPAAAGRKAMARNLSDIAAMAVLPVAAVATVAMPKALAGADAKKIYQGLRELGDKYACPVVGGDVGVWDGPLAISVSVVGRPAGIRAILRSGAKAGDAVCVTGAFGGAWRSKRHLRFMPRIQEARKLAASTALHAMIDVSDGLARDLHHLCAASGVGAEIVAEAIPIHADAKNHKDQCDPLTAALNDGEDYELLFAVPNEQADELLQAAPLEAKISRIGRIVEGSGVTLVHPDGRREKIPPGGWEHRTQPAAAGK